MNTAVRAPKSTLTNRVVAVPIALNSSYSSKIATNKVSHHSKVLSTPSGATMKQRGSSRRKAVAIDSRSSNNSRKQQQQKQKQQRYHPHDGHPTVVSDDDRLQGLASRWWADHLRSSDWLRFKPPNHYCEDYGYVPIQYVRQAKEKQQQQQLQRQQQQNHSSNSKSKISSSRSYIVKHVMQHGTRGEHYAIGYMDLYNLLRKYGTFSKNDDDGLDEILVDYNGPPLFVEDDPVRQPPPPISPPSLVHETISVDVDAGSRERVVTTTVTSTAPPPTLPPLFTSTPNHSKGSSSTTAGTCATNSAEKLWAAAETISGMNPTIANSLVGSDVFVPTPSTSSSSSSTTTTNTEQGIGEVHTVSSADSDAAYTEAEMEDTRMIAEVMIGVKKGIFFWPSSSSSSSMTAVTTNTAIRPDTSDATRSLPSSSLPMKKRKLTTAAAAAAANTTTPTTSTSFDEKRNLIQAMLKQMSSNELGIIQMDLIDAINIDRTSKKQKIAK